MKSSAQLVWQRVRGGAGVGAVFGVLCVGVGVVRIAFALVAGHDVAFTLGRDLKFLALYVAGFMIAGAVIGPLWPLRRSWLGALVMGYLGAGIVCAVCGVIVMATDDHPDWQFYPVLVAIMTVIFGTAAAITFRRE